MVGLAVGMGSSWPIIKGILIGIIPHKVIVLSALGAQYIHSKLQIKVAVVLAFLFAAVMPLGVLAGHLFIHSLEPDERNSMNNSGCDLAPNEATANIPECIMQGLGAGTIFFVTFCELLPGELLLRIGRLLELLL